MEYRVATPSYFPVMGIALRQGRLFDDRDEANPAAVALINQTAARRYFPNDNPVGKRIKFGSGVEKLPWTTIIGVVGDTRHFSLESEPRAEAYRPYAHNPLNAPILVIRTARDPGPMIAGLSGAVRSVNPGVPAYNVFRVEQLVARSNAARRFVMLLLTAFAAAALFLAAVGIYGVASQSVAQRTREIGLRMALGASAGEVQRMVLRDGLRLTVTGAIIGWLGSAALARFMGSLLFGVRPFDIAAFTVAPLVLIAVALLACYAPARQATLVDPLIALRHE